MSNLLTNLNTESFLSYLEESYNNNDITIDEVEIIYDFILKGKVVNPIDPSTTYSDPVRLALYEYIENFLKLNLNSSKIFIWARTLLNKSKKLIENRNETVILTSKSSLIPIFHRLEKVSFSIKQLTKDNTSDEPKIIESFHTLDHSFEVGSLLISHGYWKEIMGHYPSVRRDTNKISINEIDNYPVKITYPAALIFANKLSRKQNLEPIYRSLDIETIENSSELMDMAAYGDLVFNDDIDQIKRAIIQSEGTGYRLPNLKEQTYLRNNAKTANGKIWQDEIIKRYQKDNIYEKTVDKICRIKNLDLFEDIYDIENLSTAAFADQIINLNKPLFINNYRFFDLFNKLNEWGEGTNYDSLFPVSGSPYSIPNYPTLVAPSFYLGIFTKGLTTSSDSCSFRLVRTVK